MLINGWAAARAIGRGELSRSDMFVVRESRQNRPKPQRRAMSRSGAGHAAPAELTDTFTLTSLPA